VSRLNVALARVPISIAYLARVTRTPMPTLRGWLAGVGKPNPAMIDWLVALRLWLEQNPPPLHTPRR
jgi:hypothetical protein